EINFSPAFFRRGSAWVEGGFREHLAWRRFPGHTQVDQLDGDVWWGTAEFLAITGFERSQQGSAYLFGLAAIRAIVWTRGQMYRQGESLPYEASVCLTAESDGAEGLR